MKTFEESKYLLLVLGIYTDAIIFNRKHPLLALTFGRDVNPRRIAAAISSRVSDQVLKELLQLELVHADPGQGGTSNGSAAVFYCAFEAMRTAQAKLAGTAAPSDPLESWSKERPIGPIILIGLGALLLLNNFRFFDFIRLGRFWPLILIGVGFYMFRNRLSGRQ